MIEFPDNFDAKALARDIQRGIEAHPDITQKLLKSMQELDEAVFPNSLDGDSPTPAKVAVAATIKRMKQNPECPYHPDNPAYFSLLGES